MDEECVPGELLWNAKSYLAKAFMEDVEQKRHVEVQEVAGEDEEDSLRGRPLW
eukprot:CAMPEP_0172869222 /NCGR_PEP_ID=MMETSP1075-20121228/88417_1 /TAXON_ID=2916 /ORGANISM="Ceratium fusus, Strain PA161109" /LENGTH=52 /DNA_ID=CAMNT_0013719069 /DNA_START=93 /DNA_END=248 /DNA_ORIENTATION=-